MRTLIEISILSILTSNIFHSSYSQFQWYMDMSESIWNNHKLMVFSLLFDIDVPFDKVYGSSSSWFFPCTKASVKHTQSFWLIPRIHSLYSTRIVCMSIMWNNNTLLLTYFDINLKIIWTWFINVIYVACIDGISLKIHG